MGISLKALSLVLLFLSQTLSAAPFSLKRSCEALTHLPVHFTSMKAQDTLEVRVAGNPCEEALVTIRVTTAEGSVVYDYTGDFMNHMPFIIYEPELNRLVQFFTDKVAKESNHLTTKMLPPYAGVDDYYEANHDFILIPQSEYESLQSQTRPILWHTTGNASWVYVIYDPASKTAKTILRGGIFR